MIWWLLAAAGVVALAVGISRAAVRRDPNRTGRGGDAGSHDGGTMFWSSGGAESSGDGGVSCETSGSDGFGSDCGSGDSGGGGD